MSTVPKWISANPELAKLTEGMDVIDIKTTQGAMSLREFTAATMSYMPGWMRFLYGVRKYFVALIGVGQDFIPERENIAPEELSFTPGETASIFTVRQAEEDKHWIAEARDKMIAGYVGIVREPLENGENRFYFMTLAKFLHWKGRLYYTIISPFHHVVVHAMIRHALNTYREGQTSGVRSSS